MGHRGGLDAAARGRARPRPRGLDDRHARLARRPRAPRCSPRSLPTCATARSSSPTTASGRARGATAARRPWRSSRRWSRAARERGLEPRELRVIRRSSRPPWSARSTTSWPPIAAGAAERDRDPGGAFPDDAIVALADAGAHAGHRRPDADRLRRRARAAARGRARPTRASRGSSTVTSTPSSACACRRRRSCATRELAAIAAGALRAGVWGADPVPGEGEPARVAGDALVRDEDVLLGRGRPAARARARPDRRRRRAAGRGLGRPHRDRDGRRRPLVVPRRRDALVGQPPRDVRGHAGPRAPRPARRAPRAALVRPRRGAHRRDVGGRGRRRRSTTRSTHLAARPRTGDLEALAAGRLRTWQADDRPVAARRGAALDARRPTRAARREVAARARTAIADAARAILDEAERATGSRPAGDRRDARPRRRATCGCSCSSTASSRSSRAPGPPTLEDAPMSAVRLRGPLPRRGRSVAARSPTRSSARRPQAVLDACGDGPVRTAACDLGAGLGVLTAALAPRCRSLLALDAAPTAVAAARERLAPWPHARGACRDAAGRPARRRVRPRRRQRDPLLPPGRRRSPRRSRGWTPRSCPGGRLVAVHWTGAAPDLQRSADAVHDALVARAGLCWLAAHRSRRPTASTCWWRGHDARRRWWSSAAGPAAHAAAAAYRDAGGAGAVVLLAGRGRARRTTARRCRRSCCAASPSRTSSRSRTPAWYAERDVELRVGRVAALDLARRAASCSTTATSTAYDACVLATGAEPVAPPGRRRRRSPACTSSARVEHALALRAAARAGRERRRRRLGLHRLRGRGVAARCAAARSRSSARSPRPRRPRLGPEVGARLAGWLEEAGVDGALRRARSSGSTAIDDRRLRVAATRGRRRSTPTSCSSPPGSGPRSDLARDAGLALADGDEVVVDGDDAHRGAAACSRAATARRARHARRRAAAARRALGRRARPGRDRRARPPPAATRRGRPSPASGRRSASGR